MASVIDVTELFPIPAGAQSAPCPGCGREVYYITRASGVRMPVEVVGPHTFAPSAPDALTPYDGQARGHLPHCHTHHGPSV